VRYSKAKYGCIESTGNITERKNCRAERGRVSQILEMEKTVWVGPQESTARKAEATKKTCVAAPNKRDPKYQVDRLSEFLASWSMKM
jgi:hypothetical protein